MSISHKNEGLCKKKVLLLHDFMLDMVFMKNPFNKESAMPTLFENNKQTNVKMSVAYNYF